MVAVAAAILTSLTIARPFVTARPAPEHLAAE
jgi:hypothetical protein